MSDHVTNFSAAHGKLFDAFRCKDEYPIRLCLDDKWFINEREDVSFLNFCSRAESMTTVVVFKDKGSPLVYKYGGYIMIIAIDCIKFGFIFKTKNMDDR